MEVIKLTFIETSEFNDQYIRTFDTDLKSGMISDAMAAVRDSETFSASTIGRVASNLIRPSANSGLSQISGGWDTQRLRFAMVVMLADRDYHKQYSYITGYTDSNDFTVSDDGHVDFDPDMRLYFNSVTRVSLLMTDDRGSEVFRPKLESHDQILAKASVNSRDVALLRPSDVFRRRGVEFDDGPMSSFTGTHSTMTNKIGGFSNGITLSTRRNNSPTSYLHRSIDTYNKVQTTFDITDGETGYDSSRDNHSDVLLEAVDRLSENMMTNDPWFDGALSSDTNVMRQGYVTYRELLRTNPDLDEGQIVGMRPLEMGRRNEYDHSISNRGDSIESQAVTILGGSIPSLMLNAMYSRVENLIIDTHAMYDEDRVIPGMAFPFVDGLDTRSTDDYFIDQIEQTVLRDVSRNGAFAVSANITCDIDGVMEGEISIDGGPVEYFCEPVFSDALKSNVLSNSFDQLDRVSSDVLTVSESFYQDRERSRSRNISTDSRGLAPMEDRHNRQSSNSRINTSKIDW